VQVRARIECLRALTLPAVDDVRDGLGSLLETEARAEELAGQIERPDELIDEIGGTETVEDRSPTSAEPKW